MIKMAVDYRRKNDYYIIIVNQCTRSKEDT